MSCKLIHYYIRTDQWQAIIDDLTERAENFNHFVANLDTASTRERDMSEQHAISLIDDLHDVLASAPDDTNLIDNLQSMVMQFEIVFESVFGYDPALVGSGAHYEF